MPLFLFLLVKRVPSVFILMRLRMSWIPRLRSTTRIVTRVLLHICLVVWRQPSEITWPASASFSDLSLPYYNFGVILRVHLLRSSPTTRSSRTLGPRRASTAWWLVGWIRRPFFIFVPLSFGRERLTSLATLYLVFLSHQSPPTWPLPNYRHCSGWSATMRQINISGPLSPRSTIFGSPTPNGVDELRRSCLLSVCTTCVHCIRGICVRLPKTDVLS